MPRLAALLAALQERERRRAQLRAELADLDRTASSRDDGGGHHQHVLDQLRGHLNDWHGMLRQEAPAARRTLRALVAGRFVFMPRGEGNERYYEFEGPGTVSEIIAGLTRSVLVRPGGPSQGLSTLRSFRLSDPTSVPDPRPGLDWPIKRVPHAATPEILEHSYHMSYRPTHGPVGKHPPWL
jgi:hypothetical protein